MKKVKNILLMIILAVIIFVILLAIEKNEVSKYKRVEMVVTITDVPRNTIITKDNLTKYFELRECDKSLDTAHNIEKLEDLVGCYPKDTIYANTIVYDYDFGDINFENKNLENKVIGSFSVSAISDAMNGILRMGDIVRLYIVDSIDGTCKEILPYEVIIEGAFDTNGVAIEAGDVSTVATNFNIGIDKNDEADFYRIINEGKVKVVLTGSDEADEMRKSLEEETDEEKETQKLKKSSESEIFTKNEE